ncbi:hypothetical protein E1B28_010232 [Marasmius oreades]|uniref:C2H2-type domain-containing protein n=1 Tax=Marasmius oreades TaxID=181124 RepID=A0A9P7RXD2_9AGAR|nr:uncharacterized protein E1B28_010232 [Marasmius oreades]KAG7091180.1 hypothetical protein E1B28_010232 [Marasmius oreades]
MQSSFSSNIEPAGRFHEDTLEDCISQIYADLEQTDTTFAGYLNTLWQSHQSNAQLHTQPTTYPSIATQDTNLVELDFSNVPPDYNFDFAPELAFQPIEPQSAPIVPHVPLLTPSIESIFSWAPENATYCRYVDGPSTYVSPALPMNELDFGVDPMAVVSNDLANYYSETSATTNGYSSIDDYVLPPPPDFSDSEPEAHQSPAVELREVRPSRKRRVNPRWSPSSDETVSDDEYQPASRKRRVAISLPQDTKRVKVEEGETILQTARRVEAAARRGEVRENITEKVRTNNRASDDTGISLTVYDQPLLVRCPALSGCDMRFGCVKEALAHCRQSHPGGSVRHFRCIFRDCDQGFTALGDVARHAESLLHNPRKGQRCLACLRSFTRVDALKRHCNLAGAAHVALHESRVKGGVQAVCANDEGLWTLKAPEGYKDSCRISMLAIDSVSWTDPETSLRKSKQ